MSAATVGGVAEWRRFFAEEIQAVGNLQTPALVGALASIPRDAFLRPGPWLVVGQADFGAVPRQTVDADPRQVHHNLSVAIDPARQLFNGAPGVVAVCIDRLGLRGGERVLHVGCALGYYSALIAHCVGPSGQVVAVEVDEDLAASARTRLAPWPQAEVRHGNGIEIAGESYDAILVNAGMTHPHTAWLDALKPGGRLIVPLTAGMPAMKNIGKGIVAMVTRKADSQDFDARVVTFVAIYSAIGIRDAALEEPLGRALASSPFPRLARLRRDAHDASPSCWLHAPGLCLSQ